MKRIFFNAIAIMVLLAPLLMATQCKWGYPEGPPNSDEGCYIYCVVYLNYVDENGQKIPFGTDDYPDTLWHAQCDRWIDVETGKSLTAHDGDHFWLRYMNTYSKLAHAYTLAAPARDGLSHPKIKGKLETAFDYGDNPSKYLEDDIEVELHYNTPDNAYIKLIKINGEVKWDRSSFPEGKVPEDIIIDYYLDVSRLK